MNHSEVKYGRLSINCLVVKNKSNLFLLAMHHCFIFTFICFCEVVVRGQLGVFNHSRYTHWVGCGISLPWEPNLAIT